jgi:two-component system KDP operon response regulator KdpE
MARPPQQILITDDEKDLRRVLRLTLGGLGFAITESCNGEEALREAARNPFEVVLLDMNMPGMGGVETCRQLRRLNPRLQILMLTVRDSENDKVAALEAGADDYITKPFSTRELAARIKAAMRRAASIQSDREAKIIVGDIELDPARRTVSKAGKSIRFTPKEFDLLHYLMAHAGLPVSHAKLLHSVWGPEYGQELEYLRSFVYLLRKKLEDDPASPRYVLTESHLGYRFRDVEEAIQAGGPDD